MLPEIGFVLVVLALYLEFAEGHGRLIDPPSRASMWRYGFTLPQNDYDDNQGYCGGQQQLWNRFKGVCGVCGDARSPVPRAHERGGRYYAGTVVKKYREGSLIEVTTQITANHKGWYEFRLCAYDNPSEEDLERDEKGNFVEVSHKCLNKHLLKVEGGGTRWYLPAPYKVGLYTVKVKLPEGLTCQNCLFQWKWNVANSWGSNSDGESCIGCGEQEQFYACSDISIESGFGNMPPVSWSPPNIPRQRPQPESPKFKPNSPRQKETRPRHKPDSNRSHDNSNRFTSRPVFTYTHLLPTPLPAHSIPIKPKLQHPNHYPSWIPTLSTKQPSWYSWFNPRRPYVIKQGNKEQSNENSAQSSDSTSSSSYRATHTQQKIPSLKNWDLPAKKKSASPLKFWNWLSDRFISKSKPTEEETATQAPSEAPWWLKLPSSKRVLQWWKIIQKFDHKFRVTTTSMPLPWWVKKTKSSSEDSLPKYFDEKEKDIENNKVVNGISAAASKDRPIKDVVQEVKPTETIHPITSRKSAKRNCRPVGRLIQFPNMWLWCNTNCADRHCPETHCVCSS